MPHFARDDKYRTLCFFETDSSCRVFDFLSNEADVLREVRDFVSRLQ